MFTSLFTWFFIALYIGLLVRLSWIDYRFMLLPDNLTYPLLWSGLLFQICFAPDNLTASVLGAMGGYLSLWVLYWLYYFWRKSEGIGYGDMKLLAALGAWHGWQSIGWITFAATATALIWVLLRKLTQKNDITFSTTPLPFGPNLAIAGGSVGWLCSSFPQVKVLGSIL